MAWPTVTSEDPRFLPYAGAVDEITIAARIIDAEAIVQWELRDRGVVEPPPGHGCLKMQKMTHGSKRILTKMSNSLILKVLK